MTTYDSPWFQNVLDSFLANSSKHYICHASIAFQYACINKEFLAKLRELAQRWIEESSNIVVKVSPDFALSLFWVSIEANSRAYIKRQTRIDFLKWLIEKKVEISL